MDNRPDLPRSLACGEEVILDFVANGGGGVTIHKSKVGEKDSHENRAPKDLINSNLESNIGGTSSLDLAVEPVVEIVTRRSMVEETKGGQTNESLQVEWTTRNEDLETMNDSKDQDKHQRDCCGI